MNKEWIELKEFADDLFAGTTPKEPVWESKNHIWAVHNLPDTERIMIEDRRLGGICDYPIYGFDHEILYDYPERIPGYVKDAVGKIIMERRGV